MNRAPFIPVKEVILPSVITTVFVGRERSIEALEIALSQDNRLLMLLQKDLDENNPNLETDLYREGVVVSIIQSAKLPDGLIRVLVESEHRVKVKSFVNEQGVILADYEFYNDEEDTSTAESKAIERKLIDNFESYLKISNKLSTDLINSIKGIKGIHNLVNLITSNLNIDTLKKQKILMLESPIERAHEVLNYINEERDLINLENKIDRKVRDHMSNIQKNYYLKEKLKAIQEELGDDIMGEDSDLLNQIEAKKLPSHVKKRILSEVNKLKKMPPYSSEFSVIRSYIESVLEFPWNKKNKAKLDIDNAKDVLNENHYALDDVKRRILEFLAVKKLNKSSNGSILCILGPSGVGKTSLAKSIAKALGRKFSRISLGGVEDESEIRGHRRTYVGAMPGRIAKELTSIESVNPVILLDEIDKLSKGFRGDPASALLEVLDPEQNKTFVDNYFDIPIDLSNVFFIATANYRSSIPAELRDRLEIIKIDGYTIEEKEEIFKKHLIPQSLEENGLKDVELSISDKVINKIILSYTQEAGIRELKRELDKICRKLAFEKIDSNLKEKKITLKNLVEYLGEPKYVEDSIAKDAIFTESVDDIDSYRSIMDSKELPNYVKSKLESELRKLEKMPVYSSEYSLSTAYIEEILELPWGKSKSEKIDLKKASSILEENHYGLEKVKERVLEFLAVKKLNKELKGSIICLAGPPGVGKTSLSKSIAKALGRKFSRVALGGVREEAEIRGHRRTYVGAMPGRLMKEIKNAGTDNLVILLDEIDKLSGNDYRGDPAAALLEVLDPEQNKAFVDNYLDMPFDLSNVFFLATANSISLIPSALRDRLEIIYLSSYTDVEKLMIAEKYLVDDMVKESGLKDIKVSFKDGAILDIIHKYTSEAGVRQLKRELNKIGRKIAKRSLEKSIKKVDITTTNLHEYLGVEKLSKDRQRKKELKVGKINGLAWTSVGGATLEVQASLISGKGKLITTGNLADVMRESVMVALSYARSIADKLGVNQETFIENHLHVHFPEGAVPKDGPSAGIAITSAILSAVSNKGARQDVAMTGEITIQGEVLKIGGVKEKIIGAHRANIKEIILPKDNEKDLEDVPKEILKDLKIHFAEDYLKDVKSIIIG